MFRIILFRRPKSQTTTTENNVIENDSVNLPPDQNEPEVVWSKKRKQDDEGEVPPNKISRFELDGENNDYHWDLPDCLNNYLDKYVRMKVQDNDLKSNIMDLNPIPRNVRQVPELDVYIKSLLANHNKNSALYMEKTLRNIQEREWNILGPLCRL